MHSASKLKSSCDRQPHLVPQILLNPCDNDDSDTPLKVTKREECSRSSTSTNSISSLEVASSYAPIPHHFPTNLIVNSLHTSDGLIASTDDDFCKQDTPIISKIQSAGHAQTISMTRIPLPEKTKKRKRERLDVGLQERKKTSKQPVTGDPSTQLIESIA